MVANFTHQSDGGAPETQVLAVVDSVSGDSEEAQQATEVAMSLLDSLLHPKEEEEDMPARPAKSPAPLMPSQLTGEIAESVKKMVD